VETIAPTAGQDMQTTSRQEPEAPAETNTAEQEVEAELASLEIEEQDNDERESKPSGDVDESVEEDRSDKASDESTDQGDGEQTTDGTGGQDQSGEQDSKPTPKQKQKSKREKIKSIIAEKLKSLAEDMGEAASLAEQQAIQAQIAALIAYVPGFNAYGQLALPGGDMYTNQQFYEDKKVPENRKGLRNGLAQQILHEKMVDLQYNRK